MPVVLRGNVFQTQPRRGMDTEENTANHTGQGGTDLISDQCVFGNIVTAEDVCVCVFGNIVTAEDRESFLSC